MKEAEILRQGKTLIYPTDTIWGIGCNALDPSAIGKVKHIKGRQEGKSFILLMKDLTMLRTYVPIVPPQALSLLSLYEAKQIPVTILYPDPERLPLQDLSANNYIGIRIVSSNTFLQRIFECFPYPIVSSSANFSGQPSPGNFSEIDPKFLSLADYVSLEGRQDRLHSVPSSIFMVKDDGELKQLR